MDSYSYTALNESAGQIRLLSLLPGDFGDEMLISIQEVVLSMSEKPIFEALSDVWGSDADMVPIVIRGAVDTCLTVTPYLEIALRYLRYQEKLRILWIDEYASTKMIWRNAVLRSSGWQKSMLWQRACWYGLVQKSIRVRKLYIC